MFQFKKKNNKNQEVKSVAEKNENISSTSNISIPDAKDVLEISKKSWKTVTVDDVIKKIEKEASKGNIQATFYDSYISDELEKELCAKGYMVEKCIKSTSMAPYFHIRW